MLIVVSYICFGRTLTVLSSHKNYFPLSLIKCLLLAVKKVLLYKQCLKVGKNMENSDLKSVKPEFRIH